MIDNNPRIEPRKRPRQGRSAATVEAILVAATRIITRDGFEALTTNGVAELAGVSIGSLYQYFPTKDAILVEVLRRKRASMTADFDAAVAESEDLPLKAAIGHVVASVMKHQFLDPNLSRMVFEADLRWPIGDESRSLEAHIAASIATILTAHGVAQPALRARDLLEIVRGLIVSAGKAGEKDQDALSQRASLAAYGYIAAAEDMSG